MGFSLLVGCWLLVLSGAAIGWVLGGRSGFVVGVISGVVLAFVGHQLRRAFLCGIHDAARGGNVGRVAELLETDPSLVDLHDASGNTPLHCAIAHFELGVVEELLAHGANVNAGDNNGTTPLHILAAGVPDNPPPPPKSVRAMGLQEIHISMAELLLEHGANVDARTAWGWTPLETAEKSQTTLMMTLLRKHGAQGSV